MDVEAELQRMPARNLGRVSVEEFGCVWAEWETRNAAGGLADHYLVGVVRTLRWLAGATLETPVSRVLCYDVAPEFRDSEYFAALAAARSTTQHESRVGVARGAVAVLGWMYHGRPQPAYSSTSA